MDSRNSLIETIRQVWRTSFYQNTYYLMSGNIINSTLAFIFWIIAAKLYSSEVVGLGSAIISALRLLALFAELGLGISLVRYLPAAEKDAKGMINSCFTLSGSAALIISLVFLSGLSLWSPSLIIIRQDPLYFIAFLFFTLSMVLQPSALSVLLARLQSRTIFVINVVAGVFSVSLASLFSIFTDEALGLFSAIGLSIGFTLVLSVFWFIPRVQNGYFPVPGMNLKILKEMGSYAAANFAGKGFLLMINFILPLIVVNTLGDKLNAYFFIPWSIGVVLQFIPAAISNSLFAEASNDTSSLRVNTAKSLKLLLLILFPTVLAVVTIAELVLLLFGREYSENGTSLLRILALSVLPWGIIYIYIGIARVKKNFKVLIGIPVIASSLSLGLSYILMVHIGVIGAGLGYLAGQGAVALPVLLHLWRSRNKLGE